MPKTDITIPHHILNGDFVATDYGDNEIYREPEWECVIGNDAIAFGVFTENVPNWFHRKLQHFILGIEWNKLEEKEL